MEWLRQCLTAIIGSLLSWDQKLDFWQSQFSTLPQPTQKIEKHPLVNNYTPNFYNLYLFDF